MSLLVEIRIKRKDGTVIAMIEQDAMVPLAWSAHPISGGITEGDEVLLGLTYDPYVVKRGNLPRPDQREPESKGPDNV